MIEGSSSRVAYLDGWRGIAIATVLFGHFASVAPKVASYGVELFFVLSGRLMAQILFEKRMPLATFFKRRFSRIYPALLVFVAVLAVLSFAAKHFSDEHGIEPLSALGALTFTANYFPALDIPLSPTLHHIWSLAVEEHSYVLLGLITALTARRTRWIVPICFCLAALAMLNGMRLYYSGAGGVHEIYWRSDVRLAPIFLAAGLYLCRPRRGGSLTLAISLPLFLVFPLPFCFILPTALIAYAVNAIDGAPRPVIRGLSSPMIVQLGLISYSLYLWQQVFYVAGISAFVAIPAAVAVALLSYRHVEVPARRAINSLDWHSFRALASVVAGAKLHRPEVGWWSRGGSNP